MDYLGPMNSWRNLHDKDKGQKMNYELDMIYVIGDQLNLNFTKILILSNFFINYLR